MEGGVKLHEYASNKILSENVVWKTIYAHVPNMH
jgi:hypothetical protein